LRRRYHLKYKGKNIRIRYDTRLVFYSFSRCIRLWLVNESNNWLIQFTIMTGSEPNLTGSDPNLTGSELKVTLPPTTIAIFVFECLLLDE